MMRLFVAAVLPDPVRAAVVALQRDIPVGRIMAPDTLHLTLAFLGDQSERTAEAVHEALSEIRARPFPLALEGLETVGRPAPSVLWARVAPVPGLTRLHASVRRAVETAGVALRRERFRPHVTLARLRHPDAGDMARLARFLASHSTAGLPSAPVTAFGLFRSILHPEAARHEALALYALG